MAPIYARYRLRRAELAELIGRDHALPAQARIVDRPTISRQHAQTDVRVPHQGSSAHRRIAMPFDQRIDSVSTTLCAVQ